MSRVLPRVLVCLLLIAGLAQATYAAQLQTVRVLRAIACCADDCPSAKKDVPQRCCGIAPVADGTSLVQSAATSLPDNGDLVIEVLTTPQRIAAAGALHDFIPAPTGRAGPSVFLFTRHLLI